MRILIAEDDEYKRDQLLSALHEVLPHDSKYKFARSFRSAVDALDEGVFDLVLLDMTMPTFDPTGAVDIGRYEPFAGREVLSELDRADNIVPVIVVTQFEHFGVGDDAMNLHELHSQLEHEFPDSYRGYVYFDSASAEWKKHLMVMVSDTLELQERK